MVLLLLVANLKAKINQRNLRVENLKIRSQNPRIKSVQKSQHMVKARELKVQRKK